MTSISYILNSDEDDKSMDQTSNVLKSKWNSVDDSSSLNSDFSLGIPNDVNSVPMSLSSTQTESSLGSLTESSSGSLTPPSSSSPPTSLSSSSSTSRSSNPPSRASTTVKRRNSIPNKNLIPRSKISKSHLLQKELIKIAVRRKAISKKHAKPIGSSESYSKLHVKSLEAGLRVKLTLSPSIFALYKSLTPNVNVRHIRPLENSLSDNDSKDLEFTASTIPSLITKNVQLIDNNLVNMSMFSKKMLQSFNKDSCPTGKKESEKYPIFNSLKTAVQSLFGINEFTFIRVTRSTSDDTEGSTLLKLEAANPGDYWLLDEEELLEEMIFSIGKPGDVPNNLFVKKVLARPRYKSDMKLYIVPKKTDASLYIDERVLERDMVNGVVDSEEFNQRALFSCFDYVPISKEVNELISFGRTLNMSPPV